MQKVQEPEEGVHRAPKPDVQCVPEVEGQVRQIERTRREGWHRRGEGQGARYVVTGLRSMHADRPSVRPAPKMHKKASTHETIEVSDDDEPGPSRARGKRIVTMPVRASASGKPITWSQVVALESTMHNTVGQMRAMEADVHSILGRMHGMESEVAGMLEKLAEMKEGLADV